MKARKRPSKREVNARYKRTAYMLARHVRLQYGGDDPLKWPTDILKELASTLRLLHHQGADDGG